MRDRTPLLLLLALSLPAQAPPRGDARLEGRVVDPQQRPVVGAMVTAELDGEPLGKTFSDASGTFVFGRLPQRIVVVRATTRTPDIGGNWVDLLGLPRGFVSIVTMPARKVSGVVRDDAGLPVTGAWVAAAPNDWIEFAHGSCIAESDADGRYVLTHVPMGPVVVRAWAPGHDAFEGNLDGNADATLDATVERDAYQEKRLVLLDATPEQLAAATLYVRASCNSLPLPLPPALRRPPRQADGSWLVRGWPFGDELRASVALPLARVTPPSQTLAAGAGRVTRRFCIDDADATITGRLTAHDGTKTSGRLLLVQSLDEPADNHNRTFTTTAADGTFRVPSPVDRRDRFALRVFDPGAVVDALDPIRGFLQNGSCTRAWFVAEHDARTAHEVKIRPAGNIHLRVVGADQAPVPGVEVTVHPSRGHAAATRGFAVHLWSTGGPLAFGTSDLDGHVTIAGLDLRAREQLACLAVGATGFGEAPFQVGDSPACELGALQLGPTATLTGICVGEDDRPMPGARVRVYSSFSIERFGLKGSRRHVACDREGRFAFTGLVPGNYVVLALGRPASLQQVTLTDPVTDVTLK